MNRQQWQDLTTQQKWGLPIIEAYVRLTFSTFDVVGAPHLDADRPTLFISNHDDIIREGLLLNYIRHQLGMLKATLMIGDNLSGNKYLSRLMDFERVKTVPRGRGSGVELMVLTKEELETRWAAWIAHTPGRSRTGSHKTAETLPGNLIHKRAYGSAENLEQSVVIQPVVMGVEYNPIAPYLAGKEVNKILGKDGQGIFSGLVGRKGRAKVVFCDPLEGVMTSAEMRAALDYAIQSNYPTFETHKTAHRAIHTLPQNEWLPNALFPLGLERQLYNLTREKQKALITSYAIPLDEKLEALRR